MSIIEIVDKYNPDKIWIVKRYKSGNYYINQKIKGNKFYKSFQRSTAKSLRDIGLAI